MRCADYDDSRQLDAGARRGGGVSVFVSCTSLSHVVCLLHVLCCVGHQQSSPPQAPLFPPGSPEDLLQSCTHFLRGELTTLIEEQAQLATGAFHAGSATALRFRYGSHLVLVPELRKAPPSRRVSFLHPSASRRPHPPPFVYHASQVCPSPLHSSPHPLHN